MTISYETLNYDKYLTLLLQRNIKLTINSKIVRQGQLVLYSYKNFHIELYFKNKRDGSLRKTEIPIPFDIEYKENSNKLYFDYRLSSLCLAHIEPDISDIDNKFINNKLKVEILNA